MNQTINSQLPQSQGRHKLRKFREFIFIGNSSSQVDFLPPLEHTSNVEYLNTSKPGSFLSITQVHTSRQITRQLRNFKLKPGAIVQLLSKTSSGSVIISHSNRLIGIGATIAPKIIVTPTSSTR